MPSRIELEQRARVVGISPSTYPNDSKLEQRVIYAEKNAQTATATLQSTTLTQNGTAPSNGDTLTLGTVVYTYVTALTEVAASCVLTGTNAAVPANNSTVTIGGVTYTFVTTLGSAQNQVFISTTADLTMTNLVDAITGAGTAGTNYSTGTVTNTQVTAGAVTSHTTTITALSVGTFANGISVGTSEVTYSWASATLTGGVQPVANQIVIGTAAQSLTYLKSAINGTSGAGTTYSSGTAPHPLATAGTISGSTLPVTAQAAANTGTTIVTTGSTGGATLAWTGTTMANFVAGVIVAPTDSVNGQEGGALV